MVYATLTKWGNSQGVLIPKSLCDKYGLSVGDKLIIEEGAAGIELKPQRRRFATHPVDLDELFAVSDIVTLHCPLMDATRGLVGVERLASMKPGAILVNAARGGIVDETALADALERGIIRGAAIDNFESEIPSPGNPLLRLSPEARRRVLFSPHLAGVTRAAFARLIRQAIGNLENSLRGLPPQFSVNGLSSIRPSA